MDEEVVRPAHHLVCAKSALDTPLVRGVAELLVEELERWQGRNPGRPR
ncbi:hypothetical protein AKJ08_0757 [Vulgatibacter incomptus]|uniref:Uncharacterized protein n=1 Tax=Vulgatibacter incomptus TaxID=1391653 RepID=A0A0K1PA26_9BACT|nr:hypothetical protein AKJ08_0757 [Vulgatibacter incomptus]